MHPINNKNFGTNGIAVEYYNGTTTANGYIVKQTGTNKFNVTTNGTTIYPCVMATTLASAGTLGVDSVTGLKQMTMIISGPSGNEYVNHIYSKHCTTLSGNSYPWSLNLPFDSSYPIQSYDDVAGTYAAGAVGGPTTLSFSTAPANATHGTAAHSVVVATSPVAPASEIMEVFVTTSAAAIPTTGGISNTSYNNGSFGFSVTYASAGTYYVIALLSDSSYLISSALVIA